MPVRALVASALAALLLVPSAVCAATPAPTFTFGPVAPTASCIPLSARNAMSIFEVNMGLPVAFGTPAIQQFYPVGGGNMAPVQSIEGPATGMQLPAGLTFDRNSYVFVADGKAGTVMAYDAYLGAGNVAPIVLTPWGGTFTNPFGITIDDRPGNMPLYVDDPITRKFYAFKYPGSGTLMVPQAGQLVLTGGSPSIYEARLSASDDRGRTWVASTLPKYAHFPEYVIFGIAPGVPSPFRIISSGVVDPVGVATRAFSDASGMHHWVYNTNRSANTITIHDQDTGALLATVTSAALNKPTGIAVTFGGNMYVANYGDNSILQFDSSAGANAVPISQIIGPNTNIHHPMGLYLDGTRSPPSLNGPGNTSIPAYISSSATALSGAQSSDAITAGADGNYWVADVVGNQILKVVPGTYATTRFAIPTASARPRQIISGPNGAIWFTEVRGGIGHIAFGGSSIVEYALPSGHHSIGLTVGADGNVWFTELSGTVLGKITPAGAITEYALPTGATARFVTAAPGSAKQLYFTGTSAPPLPGAPSMPAVSAWDIVSNQILPAPASFVNGDLGEITVGADCNVYFTDYGTNSIGIMNTQFSATEYPLPSAGASPGGLAVGQDGNVWVTEPGVNKVARVQFLIPNITEFNVPSPGEPIGIAAGADGKLDFTERSGSIATVRFQ